MTGRRVPGLRMVVGGGAALALLTAGWTAPAPAGCAPGSASEEGGHGSASGDAGGEAGATPAGDSVGLLVRGRLLEDTVELEPVFRTSSPGKAEEPEAPQGPHRLRGLDAEGAALFEVTFEGARVADLPGAGEEHFALVHSLAAHDAARLHRLEARSAEGAAGAREAGEPLEAVEEGVGAREAVTARAVGEGRVRVRWDGDRFPAAMIRDPESGAVLAFARNGEATVSSEGDHLEVILSEGVHSAGRTVAVGRPGTRSMARPPEGSATGLFRVLRLILPLFSLP